MQEISSITDIDGNIYRTVKIGSQLWMAENLRTTKYSDGTSIPLAPANEDWGKPGTPAYCWYYNSKERFAKRYGALYNWYAIDTGKLSPSGWRIPGDDDWRELETSLEKNREIEEYTAVSEDFVLPAGMEWDEFYPGSWIISGGEKLKEKGTRHWEHPNKDSDNGTGFTALPGGLRFSKDGSFAGMGFVGNWWTSSGHDRTTAWYRGLYCDNATIGREIGHKNFGFSVRCILDL